ncbi:beta-lactamase/transpeptidase-like protein [Colletotrichum phormii]|uniref:Beta-lactamase/transpeptidase-like protein n=1 Tax=Colletotrichum phormii TaxID=359342 RepID=A0AAJ0E7T3_9PEZI|nr:beta-lactamase/transpeptidase-like protein [Colletotrichum phormii]KAK1621916.1 beta-lactamase/transpeptidase-like protein [Colletotrichum phormii]
MRPFEKLLRDSLQDDVFSSLVLFAKRLDGGPSQSWLEQAPVDKQTVFTLASSSKLPTTVAVLQFVDRRLLTLDTDVSTLLSALSRQKVLVGWRPDGSPILNEHRNPITLRHLLTHSAGTSYYFQNKSLRRLRSLQGRLPEILGSTIEDRFDDPLLFEPREGWEYGCGLDWAGKLVEQLTSMSLETYLRLYLWAPLEASSVNFWPHAKGRHHKVASLTERIENTGRLEFSIFSNDTRVLQPDSVELMFQGNLSDQSRAALQAWFEGRKLTIGDFYRGELYDWGLGGMLIDGRRSEAQCPRGQKTLAWGGGTNQFWFIDRSNGVCGLIMSHVIPPQDPQIEEIIGAFQRHVYRHVFPSFL